MSGKQRNTLIRVVLGAVLLVVAWLLPLEGWVRLLPFLAAYLVTGGDVLWKAGKNILRGQIFDENFLMCIATIGAFVIGDYPEGVAVLLFYQVGQMFERYAVGKSRSSISELMDIRPDTATIRRDGALVQVAPEEVRIGDTIVVSPGEKIPLDGVVRAGASSADTSALTGESLPRDLAPGDEAISGCINLTGVVEIEVTKPFGESTVSKILDLVENAASKKAHTENFVTRFARYYTPCVVAAAALLAVLPPLFVGDWFYWLHNALIFLVISCPCALVISVPLGFFGGIGGASKQGILVKGSNYLEALSQADIVVFDKTGTLTKGSFTVTEVRPQGIGEAELLQIAALTESYSSHPISQSLKAAYGKTLELERVAAYQELAGRGVCARVDGRQVYAGNAALMEGQGIAPQPPDRPGTAVHVAIDGAYAGYILIADEPKEDAAEAVRLLRQAGVRRTVMLTGDAKAVGEYTARQLGLDEVHAELLPADKVEQMERLHQQTRPKGKLVFVGDGINDAPVLSQADIGVAMGGLGSDAAIEAADIVVIDDKPSKVATSIRIARRTMRIVRQNIVLALAVKAVVMVLGAVGMANMWEAVFADVGVSVLAILNAVRALRPDK